MAKQVKKQTKKASKKSKPQAKKKGAVKKVSRVKAKSKVAKKKAAPKKKQLKKAASKKSSTKRKKVKKAKPAKKTKRSKANNPLLAPVTLSSELAALFGGKSEMPRTEVMKKIWQYIKKHNLQDPKNRRNIRADQQLKGIFKGKSSVGMFELTKLISKHLS